MILIFFQKKHIFELNNSFFKVLFRQDLVEIRKTVTPFHTNSIGIESMGLLERQNDAFDTEKMINSMTSNGI